MPHIFGRDFHLGAPNNIDNLVKTSPFGRVPITKYCDENTYKSMLAGNVWLGSHAIFKAAESQNAVMSDFDEGRVLVGLSDPNRYSSVVKIGGGTFRENRSYGVEPGAYAFAITRRVNHFLFCVTDGPYTAGHHQIMIYGDSEYGGNRDYRFYIVFDKYRLAQIIADNIADNFGEVGLTIDKCSYNDRETIFPPGFVPTEHDLNMEAIYSKPNRFKIENEVRIAVELDSINAPKSHYLKLSCRNIGQAIISRGGEFKSSIPDEV